MAAVIRIIIGALFALAGIGGAAILLALGKSSAASACIVITCLLAWFVLPDPRDYK